MDAGLNDLRHKNQSCNRYDANEILHGKPSQSHDLEDLLEC